ncbi:TetR/AcrR family transcriptional regulator [Cryobacterium sp. SO2]|uniref:TetR/AcrR family transcriptional regulator n=1 Tax=Cryobacterium sp. SO2 TaxID=1897060 RepID=UPI00223CC693|nr:TetR/AcrR family transcriptional regulator [Cryobacterium sp. SO2]WEO77018.1 TetR/AcrR family transcriptional regulator [Cryobacterium sp. SO2]
MTDSATTTRVERRMRKTASSLTAVSRRLTAERGLAGFTIEEVCDEVDVSRRTFFNYFACKEDAVIGENSDNEFEILAEAFLAGTPGDWSRVLQDLIEFAITHIESGDMDPTAHTDFMAALEREPRLMTRFIGVTRERERQLRALIAQREGASEDDPRAAAVVSVLATLMQSSVQRFVDPANTQNFSTILLASLAAFRTVLAAPTP